MAAFNPKLSSDIEQLSKAVGYSRKCLKVYRDNRIEILRQLVGNHYSNNGADDKVPINLLELAINIYMQRLAAQAPQAEVTTDYTELKEICTRTEISGNQLLEDMKLGDTLQMAVMGGIVCQGIVKTGLNLENVEVGGENLQSGKAFAAYVSMDDWVQDMTASDDEGSQYEGNFYYTTKDEAEKMFPGYTGKFEEIDKQTQDNEDKAHDLSESSGDGQREEFRPTVRLLDIYLRKQKKVLRCSTKDDDGDPICEVLTTIDWSKRKRGPYHKLAFMKIDNNAMPVAPAMHWRDIHDLSNRIFRKLGRQANRQKTVTGVRAGSDADGNRILDADDGQMIKLDDPQGVREYKYGGIQPESLGFLVMIKDLYSYMAGNLDVLGGLGPQSETLGQDQLLSASASMRIQKMQKSTIAFAKEVIEDIFMYMWEDPLYNPTVTKKVKGFDDISIQVPFGAEERADVEFLRLNIDIEPYSMQHTTPEAKLQGLRTIFMEFVAPLMPMMEAQGVSIDVEMLFRKIGKLGNIPELNDIIVYSNPVHEPQPQQAAGKPATTTRNYNRRSVPSASNAGKSQLLQQALFGGNKLQGAQVDSIMRPTG